MWDFSLYCDEQMERNPNWHLTEEGKIASKLVREENERLKRVMEHQRIAREQKLEEVK